MGIEYKSVAVGGVSEVKDEGDGVITAYVSVTGVEDNVKDIIEPGAYKRTLNKRTPKGVWGHQWLTPTSKTLTADELPPGHDDLPKQLSDGTDWPSDAGALRIKMQFNMKTPRGRDAYHDVVFFGDQQEWSIGYSVPDGASYKDDKGRRRIKDLDLFEYSPVLFGAMSHARTASVKDAQIGMKLLVGVSAIEIKSLEDAVEQYRKDNVVAVDETETASDFVGDEEEESGEGEVLDDVEDIDGVEPPDDDELDDDDDEEYEDDDEEDELDEDAAVKALASSNFSLKDLREAYDVIGKVLDVFGGQDDDGIDYRELGYKALVEAKATGYDTISEAVDGIDVYLDPADAKSLRDAAKALDAAMGSKDHEGIEDAATDLFDIVEKVMDEADDDISLKTVARTVADKNGAYGADEEDDEEAPEDGSEEDPEDLAEGDEPAPKKKHGKKTYLAASGIEYKSGPFAEREFGMPVGSEDLEAKERQKAFVSLLENDALLSLGTVLEDIRGNTHLKSVVEDEIESRLYIGEITSEEKLAIQGSASGQQGRGGGRPRQAANGFTAGDGPNFGSVRATKKPSAKKLRSIKGGIKKPGTSKKTVTSVRGTKKVVNRMAGGDQSYKARVARMETKRDFSTNQRDRASKKGNAMSDGSFPIENAGDLKNAIQACGRASDPEKAKMHIKKRAKELGKEGMLPDSWKTATIDTTEVKSLESFLNNL